MPMLLKSNSSYFQKLADDILKIKIASYAEWAVTIPGVAVFYVIARSGDGTILSFKISAGS